MKQNITILFWLKHSRCSDQLLPTINFLQKYADKNELKIKFWGLTKQKGNFSKPFSSSGIFVCDGYKIYLRFYLFLLSKGSKIFLLTSDQTPSTNNTPISFIRLLRKFGVPSLSIDHGFVITNFKKNSHIYNFYADVRATWSEYVAIKFINELGKKKSQVTLVGNPKYDEILKLNKKQIRNKIRGSLGIKDSKIVILAVGFCIWDAEKTWQFSYNDMYNAWVETFKGIKKAVPKAFVLIKPHPYDLQSNRSLEVYKNSFENVKIDGALITSNDFYPFDLISASDIVIFQYSSMAIEAALMGVPSIMAKPSILVPDAYLISDNRLIFDATASITKISEKVENSILKILSAPSIKQNDVDNIANLYGIPLDGKSTERFALLALKMAKEMQVDDSIINFFKRILIILRHSFYLLNRVIGLLLSRILHTNFQTNSKLKRLICKLLLNQHILTEML